ncbi:DUF4845 domain-containing protein [Solimonas sp. K1W22B-7]|uniref:DUF4845 domain-containing protein n=1 Tax=Solimonas sp. K1W22B-7 TaxID=2303331 RepID=UPI000E332EAB|nr:DUF4845 domain-containing protein [Solimonas sp. K1W22B-7]AXQ30221.1 DUF4845 domain-containing protein [Solimonas sp. K1W22B-7]
MQLRHRQKGIGWFGLLFIFGTIAFVAIVGGKCFPLYMNQFKLQSALNKVATGGNLANDDAGASLRSELQRYWDIDDITRILPKDIKLRRNERGRFLIYDYEAREKLFYNIFIVIHFQGEVQVSGGSGSSF